LGDAAPGSIVELRRFQDAAGRQRAALAVRSDLPIDKQLSAQGATWLDRQGLPFLIASQGTQAVETGRCARTPAGLHAKPALDPADGLGL
jgi:hypothetical protein